jgi:murein DD-endopeptidase MepM/ murein hydrolase activator NlpD
LSFLRRRLTARRKPGQALAVADARRLPAIYLAKTESKPSRSLPAVYHCEPGADGATSRLKWLASTCLAGMVGVCMIGIAIYASLNMRDGSGMMNSIRRASLAALQPMRGATRAHDDQNATGKEDRIQVTSEGFVTRDVIHDTVVKHEGSREYIAIKPYLHIVAGLGATMPPDVSQIPPFNPFKLYTDSTPIGADGTGSGGEAPSVSDRIRVNVEDLPGDTLPADDGVELDEGQVDQLVGEAAENFGYAEQAGANGEGGSEATLQQAAYHLEENLGHAPNTTVIQKSLEDSDDDTATSDDEIDGAETKSVAVGRGDTLAGIIEKVGGEPTQAKAIVDALSPIFAASDLKPGQQIRFTLVLAPSDTGQMELVKVSVFDKGDVHLATVARNNEGEYVASALPMDPLAKNPLEEQTTQRVTLYTSFYHAALSQHLSPDTILKLLRVHSYDVDFKQKAKPGDRFEAFLNVPEGQEDKDGAGDVLYTSMTVDAETRSFWRFRTPDGQVDYYDAQGNSAKKFLMRNPVKGGRYTSGFGMRKHPLLGVVRMHTGVDWAAPPGTPILAAGDGIVEAVGRQGGYGNYIRVRHSNGFATGYGHLSRYADGLAPGVRMKQGQVLGYVGSTGLSSGPHCHFEILVNNKFVNPMTIQVPRGLQLTGKLLAEFQKERKRIDGLMQLDPVTAKVANAVQ